MKMQYVDTMGVVYSSRGLRFGGFPTALFLKLTEDLEKLDLGVRYKIIAEAHYLAMWLHKFPGLAFLFGILYSQSLTVGFLYFITAFALETLRFRIFGASPVISYLSRLWDWVMWPAFLLTSATLWSMNTALSLILIIFLFGEGLFMIISTALLALIRFTVGTLAYYSFAIKDRRHWILYMEALALQYVIDRWRMKLLPPKEAFKYYEISKEDIEFYELNSKESYMRAYANRPLLNIVVSYLWLQSVGGLILVAYNLLIIRNFMAVILSLFATVIALVLFFILHEWALRHPEQTGDKKE